MKRKRRYKIELIAQSMGTTADELLDNYQDQGYSMVQVGKMLSLDGGSIAGYLKSKGRVWQPRDLTLKRSIVTLIEKRKRNQTIAKEIGCSVEYVRQLRREFGLPNPYKKSGPKTKYTRRVLPSQWDVESRWGMPIRQLIQDLVDQGFSLRKVSLVLGCGRETVRAHAKGIVLPPKEL